MALLQLFHNVYNISQVNSSWYYCQWMHLSDSCGCIQAIKHTQYTPVMGLLVLGFLEMILNTDGCLGLLCFFRRVPPPLGLLPDGKQVSWTRSRQFLCTFISQSSTTTNISFSILFAWRVKLLNKTVKKRLSRSHAIGNQGYYYYYYNHFTTLCPGLHRWVGTRRINHSGVCWSRHDGVAVPSAEPYASYLHFTPEDNHASTSSVRFLRAGCPTWHPTNSDKALKAKALESSPVIKAKMW